MAWDDRIVAALDDPEKRARFLRYAWLVSLLVLLFGYTVIFWKLR